MKTNRILFAVASALTLYACSKEELFQDNGKTQFTFGATTEEIESSADSKTELGSDGLSVVFRAGESITVFDGIENNRFTTGDSGMSAQFSGSAVSGATRYVVVSPYNENYTFEGSIVTYEIPDVQVATPGSADPNALVTAGRVLQLGKEAVTLTPAVALMKVTVPEGLTVKTIQIGGGRGANIAIAGRYTFNTANQMVGTVTGEEYKTFITLVPQAGQSTIAPGNYYVAVCPKNYDGLVVSFTLENNLFHKRKTSDGKSYNIERKKVYNLGTLNTSSYTATTGKAVLRMAGDEVQFTGRLKKLAGGAGTAITDDNNIRRIVFHSHSLVPFAIIDNDHIISSGQQNGVVPIYASYKDGVVDIYTEGTIITLHANSANLFRNFAALETVIFDDVTADAGTNLNMMFRNDYKLKRVDFGNCDFSNVANMSFMFSDERMQEAYYLKELKQVNFGSTATTSVTNFKGMFCGCTWMTELILGHNFTVSHLADNTMCNQMFTDTAKESNQAAGSDVSKKCRLYMTQEQYDAMRADGKGTGELSNSNLNPARFWFNPVTAATPAPGLTPEEGTQTTPDPGPTPTGPKFCIFGDSISTFAGYIQGYTTYYPYNPNSESNTVDSVDKTYWMQVINKFKGSLAMNISYSGSCVSYAEEKYEANSSSHRSYTLSSRKTRCFLTRYAEHSDLGNPDVILLYGGTNDRVYSKGNVPRPGDNYNETGKYYWTEDGGLGQYAPAEGEVEALCKTASEDLDTDYYMHAYVVLLRKMLADHPNVKIACLVGDGMTDAQDAWIKGVTAYMDANGYQGRIKAVSFHNAGNTDGKKYDPNIPKQQASVHPNALGMTYMANFIYNELKDWL